MKGRYVSCSFGQSISYRARQLLRWAKMLSGHSYHHQPQKLGPAFEPGQLKGYFNDLTHKARWSGHLDAAGIPYYVLSDGRKFWFPILITQKALGHWDRWLLEADEQDKKQFLLLCDWLVEHQDQAGGWDTWRGYLGPEYPKYSAMTQGQALSVLSRAVKLTGCSKYARCADKAAELMCRSVETGGVTYYQGDDVFLEEKPSQPRNTVLNGWIFSWFGLYDYQLLTDDARIAELMTRSLGSLAKTLFQYDSGFWSYYDLRGNISSPFYHRLHISQLEALSLVSSEPVFRDYQRRWMGYERNLLNKGRAVLLKAYQKLREPARVTVIG